MATQFSFGVDPSSQTVVMVLTNSGYTVTDGRTDGRTDGQPENIMPPSTSSGWRHNESFLGGKKRKIFPSTSGFEPARSKVMRGRESSHMTSYLLLIVTTWLGSTVLKI